MQMQGGHARVHTSPYGNLCSEPESDTTQELSQLSLYHQLNGDVASNVPESLSGYQRDEGHFGEVSPSFTEVIEYYFHQPLIRIFFPVWHNHDLIGLDPDELPSPAAGGTHGLRGLFSQTPSFCCRILVPSYDRHVLPRLYSFPLPAGLNARVMYTPVGSDLFSLNQLFSQLWEAWKEFSQKSAYHLILSFLI